VIVASCRGKRQVIGVLSADLSLGYRLRASLEQADYSVVNDGNQGMMSQLADLLIVDCLQDDHLLVETNSVANDVPVIAIVQDLTDHTAIKINRNNAAALLSIDEACGYRLILTVQQQLATRVRPSADLTCTNRHSNVGCPLPNSNSSEPDLSEFEKLKAENKSLSALNAVTLSLMDRMELTELLQRIADTVIELTDSDAVYISMLHESEAYLEMVASAGGFEQIKGFRHALGEGIAGTAWLKKKLVFADNYAKSSNSISQFSWIAEACAVPILIGEKIRGVIGITYRDKGSKLRSKLALIDEFSKLASLAIENATLTLNTEIELKRTETLRQLSQDIYSSSSIASLFDRISVALADVFDLRIVCICQWDGELMSLYPSHQWKLEAESIVPITSYNSYKLSEDLCQRSLDQRRTLKVDRSQLDECETLQMKQQREHTGIGATITVPIAHDSDPWGVIAMHRGVDQRDFSESDLNLLDVLGKQISAVVHRHGRFRFEHVLDDFIKKPKESRALGALIFLDLDGFKKINDTLGHAIGDELLKLVPTRLLESLKPTDTLARMGGDEFAILLTDLELQTDAVDVAQRIVASLKTNFLINGVRLTIGASVGISFISQGTDNEADHLRQADIAMYQAKEEGKNRVHCFSESLAIRYQKRIQLELDIQAALCGNQFELYYQPQVSTASRTVDGAEALIRWNHPTSGLISPADFIVVAEECGLISEIGNWVVKQACHQISDWICEGNKPISVSVNISAQHFNQDGFVEFVLNVLKESGLNAELLHLEVTESVVMHNVENIVTTLNALREYGIRISVDDFGTGYSSLKYLQDLPLDILKIDRAFVVGLDPESPTNSVANTIVYLANSFGLKTVAEGVETPEQLECIANLGCDWIQGYIYSKPIPLGALNRAIENIEEPTHIGQRAA